MTDNLDEKLDIIPDSLDSSLFTMSMIRFFLTPNQHIFYGSVINIVFK